MLSEISVKQQVCDTHTHTKAVVNMVTNSGLDSQTLLERHNETHGYHLQVLHESR